MTQVQVIIRVVKDNGIEKEVRAVSTDQSLRPTADLVTDTVRKAVAEMDGKRE